MTQLCPPLPFDPGRAATAVVAGLVGLLFVLVGLGPVPLHAQDADSTEIKRFRLADTYLRAGKFEKAITILESLYDQSPDNPSFYRKLKDAYESIKRYGDAMQLVDDRLDKRRTPQLLAEKARLLYRNENEAAADSLWTVAIEQAPERATTYRTVYQTLIDVRHFPRAIEILKQARTQLGDETLFRTELAYLYGLDGQHRKAMREYVALLTDSPNQFALVRNRLQSFVDQGEGTEASIDVLESAVEQHPLNPSFRKLLAWLYMSTDNYEDAYDVYRALDRLQKKNGQTLHTFAQKAADADQFAVATKAFEAILDRYPEADIAPAAQRALGDTYRRWAKATTDTSRAVADSMARYDAARSAYRAFLDEYPNHKDVPKVLARLGTLQLDVYRDLESAQNTLKEVVSSYPDAEAANNARYDLGRIALLEGDLERARLLFSRLADRLRSGELAEQARFELARLQFYQGHFDAAQTQAKATSANTASDVANDAIELKVLIQENQGPDSLNVPLQLYARAQLDLRRHQYAQAGARLDSLLSEYGRHSLADEAQFRRAGAFLAEGDTSSALQRYRELSRRHPRSPYADRSLFRLGTLEEERGNTEQAISLYDRLLDDYPQSLLAGDARTRLRTLRRTQS